MKGTYLAILLSVLAVASFDVIAITITPTFLELSDTSLIGEFTLENGDSESKLFQAAIKKWDQQDTTDVFTTTNDVIVLPLMANIQPNKKQKFRVILRKQAEPQTQNTYRLFFTETAQRSSVKKSGLSFLLIISVPIFSNGKNLNIAHETKWSLTKTPKDRMGELSLKNSGANTFIITELALSGKSDFNDNNMHYILPGSEYRWQISLKKTEEDIKAKYKISGKPQVEDLKLKIQKPPQTE